MADKKPINIRINKVYTRTGDGGKTNLIGGKKRWKDDIRVEAYGTVDELNSELGICKELLNSENDPQFTQLINQLITIQNELFNLGTQLASVEKKENSLPKLSDNAISLLELEIDKINENIPELKSFILPGGSMLNAQFHMARNVCRRAERRAVSLSKIEDVDCIHLIYLNRLSDALFVWSRWISYIKGNKENLWEPNY